MQTRRRENQGVLFKAETSGVPTEVIRGPSGPVTWLGVSREPPGSCQEGPRPGDLGLCGAHAQPCFKVCRVFWGWGFGVAPGGFPFAL